MRQVQASEFRTTFASYDEPIEVIKYKAVLGTWIPGSEPTLGTIQVDVADTEPVVSKMAEAQNVIDMQANEIRELKRLLAAQARPGPVLSLSSTIISDDHFGKSYAVPKPGKAK